MNLMCDQCGQYYTLQELEVRTDLGTLDCYDFACRVLGCEGEVFDRNGRKHFPRRKPGPTGTPVETKTEEEWLEERRAKWMLPRRVE